VANTEPDLNRTTRESSRTISSLRDYRLETVCLILLSAYGVFLRIFQYASNYSLHLDECLLAMNLLQRDLHGLSHRLPNKQVGPLGFLYGEKLLMMAGGNGPLVMRFLPFLSSVLAVVLFCLLAKKLFSGLPLLVAVALFSANQSLVFYSATMKQYSIEALVAIVMIMVALPLLKETPSRRDYALAAASALPMWFSFTSVLVLAGIGMVLTAHELRNKARHAKQLGALFAAWIVIFLPFYWISIRPSTSRPEMVPDWIADYLPLHPVALMHWIGPHFSQFFAATTTWKIWPLAAILFLAGVWCVLRSRDWRVAMLFSAIFVCLVAAALHKYPFAGRLQLFLMPSAILLIVAGYNELTRIRKLRFVAHSFAGVLALWCCFSAAKSFLVQHSHLDSPREVMHYMVAHWQPGDHVCVSEVAEQTFLYYDRDQKIPPVEYSLNYSGRALPPGRVWFFYFRTPWSADQEYQPAFHSLEEQGTEIAHFDAELHSVALFVINEAARNSPASVTTAQAATPQQRILAGLAIP